jgi:hypothetical protein
MEQHHPAKRVAPGDVADYSAEMARELCSLCEAAGLSGLATLFYAAHHEAARATVRLREPPKA